jgi:hypothetical protein
VKSAARLRRFRRVVDRVLRRSWSHLLLNRTGSSADGWRFACKLEYVTPNIVEKRPS